MRHIQLSEKLIKRHIFVITLVVINCNYRVLKNIWALNSINSLNIFDG